MSVPVRKAIFPVGGLGTRFLPATKSLPKEMLPVVDKPLIQYAVEEAWEAGIEELVFVTGRGKTAIEDHFDLMPELQSLLEDRGGGEALERLRATVPPAGRIACIRQQEPLGLGHAVWCARSFVGRDPVAVLLADDLVLARPGCLKQMIDARRRVGGNMVAVMAVPATEIESYGVVTPGACDGPLIEIRGLVEKPRVEEAPSNLAVIGRYIIEPAVFDDLGRLQKGAGGEIQLTDALARQIGAAPLHGFRFAGRRFDCGSKVGWLEANIAYALERHELRDRVAAVVRSFA